MGVRRRRVAAMGAAMLIALGGVVATGAAAQAVPPGCSHSYGYEAVDGNYVLAYNWWYCDDGQQIAWPASVSRYQSSGALVTVASARGDAFYFCTGTAYHIYRVGSREFGVFCS